MAEKKGKKRLLKRWEVIMVIISLLILAFVIMQQMGINVVYKTEKTEIIEDPHPGY